MSRKINIFFTLIALASLLFAINCGQAKDENQSPQNVIISLIGGGDGDLSVDYDADTGIATYQYETNIDETGHLYSYVFGDQTTAGYNIDTLGHIHFQIFPNADTGEFEGDWGSVILNRYRVSYRRTDGRAIPGVDVPYPFDGACHVYLKAGETGDIALPTMLLVRGTAKDEPPLSKLTRQHYGEDSFLTVATIEFWGKDLMDNAVYVRGDTLLQFLLIDGYGFGGGGGDDNGDDEDNEILNSNPFAPSRIGRSLTPRNR